MSYIAFGAAVLLAKFSLTCAGGAVNAAMDVMATRGKAFKYWAALLAVSGMTILFGALSMAALDLACL